MATQKDLAKFAGVSAGTVSNVISGTVQVSDRSREKVLKAVRALNYQPNLMARSLKTNRTNTLGIIVPELTLPFYPRIIRGVEQTARAHSYFLLVVETLGDYELEVEMLRLLRPRVDGILLATAGDQEWSGKGSARPNDAAPLICVDRVPEGLRTDSVCVDNLGAAELGVSHLLSMGHRRIAILTGPLTLRNEQQRLEGYRRALQLAGVPAQDSLIWASSFNRDEIRRACQKGLLRSKVKPTAIFATNGFVAIAILQTAYEMGLSTPADFAFATIDDIATEEFFQPRVTMVIQPASEIGCRAAELALKRIASKSPDTKPVNIQVPATLVVRETSIFNQ